MKKILLIALMLCPLSASAGMVVEVEKNNGVYNTVLRDEPETKRMTYIFDTEKKLNNWLGSTYDIFKTEFINE